MEGEKKKDNSRGSKGKKAGVSPGRIDEYDFFVTWDNEVAQEVVPDEPLIKKKEKKNRNKSMAFFLSK
jgi:hypothetical protein